MNDAPPVLRFAPRPRVERVAITPREACWVLDDALAEPEAWVDFAARHRGRFDDATHNAYPGPEWRLPDEVAAPLSAMFALHLRERLGLRRVERMVARLALTRRAPQDLKPFQSICHVDRLDPAPGRCIAASVLYLFRDDALGGTSFYVPTRPMAELAVLLRDAATLDAVAFEHRHGIAPGYMVDSNAWFQRIATVPARFNRLIAYNGALFHSGDIRHPERLVDDPARGRLTLNGFFTGTRPFGAAGVTTARTSASAAAARPT